MIKPLQLAVFTRARKRPCTTIVLHSTDGRGAQSSISWLAKIGLSYHYIIERDGSVVKCAPTTRVAFHAGASVGPDGPNVNDYSIGISFANWESKGEKITPEQVKAAADVVHEIRMNLPTVKYITRHRDISPGRKTDPALLTRADYEKIAAGMAVWK